jgi:signal transduction histidine kinase
MSEEPKPPLFKRMRPVHWRVLDCLAAAGYAGVLSLVAVRHPAGVPVPVGLAAVAVLCLAIALRRRAPLVALGVALAVLVALRWPYQSLFPAWSALYLVTVAGRRSHASAALAAVLAAPLIAVPLFDRAILLGLITGLIWTIGHAVGRHRDYERQLRLYHAQQVEAELATARRGVTEERIRIAREPHDVVAHSMSVITVQAGFGSLVIDEHPERARAALGAIETTGREALTEMRLLLGVLRADHPGRADGLRPTPRLADLRELVARTEKAGLRIALEITGRPRDLAPGVELSAYRIVQEALTNVVKHAETPAGRVSIAYGEDELSIEVTDDGQGHRAVDRHGHGLIGMRERVHLYGGRLRAGPLPERGFQVSARLPLVEAGS